MFMTRAVAVLCSRSSGFSDPLVSALGSSSLSLQRGLPRYRSSPAHYLLTGIFEVMADKAAMQALIKAQGDSDLVACLIDKRITLEVQYKLVKGGISTLGRLAGIEDDRDAFRKTIAEIAEIDPKDGVPAKLVLSDLVEAWHAATLLLKSEL